MPKLVFSASWEPSWKSLQVHILGAPWKGHSFWCHACPTLRGQRSRKEGRECQMPPKVQEAWLPNYTGSNKASETWPVQLPSLPNNSHILIPGPFWAFRKFQLSLKLEPMKTSAEASGKFDALIWEWQNVALCVLRNTTALDPLVYFSAVTTPWTLSYNWKEEWHTWPQSLMTNLISMLRFLGDDIFVQHELSLTLLGRPSSMGNPETLPGQVFWQDFEIWPLNPN